jgi:hypothetical protein
VSGAFEFSCPDVAQLQAFDVTTEELEAAAALERALIEAEPVANSADVILNVGYDGSIAGRLRVSVTQERGEARVQFGHEGEPTDAPTVVDIRENLKEVGDWSIYYMSGHAVHGSCIYQERRTPVPFGGWRFEDLNGFCVDREKPAGRNPREIHAAIGENGDTSLFSWVVRAYPTGSLLCDDGPGEIADFLHIEDDGTLTLIHVKGAANSSPRRRVAVGPYEVVVSQAVKNLLHLDTTRLAERLAESPIAAPAAWCQGVRVPGRADFLDSLACREPVHPLAVVVVQPHLTRSTHQRLRALGADARDPELHRLWMLEMLLHGTTQQCQGKNARFTVVGDAA